MKLYNGVIEKINHLQSIADKYEDDDAVRLCIALHDEVSIGCVNYMIDGNNAALEAFIIYRRVNSRIAEIKAAIKERLIDKMGEIPIHIKMEFDKSFRVHSAHIEHSEKQCQFCESEMQLEESDSLYKCSFCGFVLEMKGSQLESCIEVKTNSNYKPNEHMLKCLTHIYGVEKKHIPSEIVENIQRMMKRDGVTKKTLTPQMIRDPYLKSIEYKGRSASCFNLNVTKIYCIITGQRIKPPTHDEIQQISHLFDIAEQIYVDYVKPPDKSNRPFYNHMIGQIIQIIYWDRPKRVKIITPFIHQQLVGTHLSNCEIWKKLVAYSDGALKIPSKNEYS